MNKFILFFVLSAVFLDTHTPTPVHAWIPGSVWGKVVAQLPDGQRIPLPNVALFRTDWWRWPYCNEAGRAARSCKLEGVRYTCCFGDQDGVEVYTGTDGNYLMGNEGNTPAPIPLCVDNPSGGEAKLCPAGPRGKVPVGGEAGSCSQIGWCGFNCGSNPHQLEPYLPANYQLPGNLQSLGFRASDATFEPLFVHISTANDENQGPHDFTLMWPQSPATPVSPTLPVTPTTIDIHQESRQQQAALLTQGASPHPSITPAPTGFLGLKNAEFEEKIAAWLAGSITTQDMSAFVSNLVRNPGLQSTYCIPRAGGCEKF